MEATERLSLDTVLQDERSALYLDFETYLGKTFCYENLAFWNRVREYEASWCGGKTSDAALFQMCRAICNTFILARSSQEINIQCELRETILRQASNDDTIRSDIFANAKKAVWDLMHHNSFIPWLSTWATSPASPATCSPPSTPSPTDTSFPDIWPTSGNRFSCSSLESTTSDYDPRRPPRYLSMLHRVRSLLSVRLDKHPKTSTLATRRFSFSSRKMTR